MDSFYIQQGCVWSWVYETKCVRVRAHSYGTHLFCRICGLQTIPLTSATVDRIAASQWSDTLQTIPLTPATVDRIAANQWSGTLQTIPLTPATVDRVAASQ